MHEKLSGARAVGGCVGSAGGTQHTPWGCWAIEVRCVAAGPSQGLCAKPVIVSCKDSVKPGGIKSRLL